MILTIKVKNENLLSCQKKTGVENMTDLLKFKSGDN